MLTVPWPDTGELRALNERAWAGEEDLFPVGKSLDSKLAKHTAYIKRLRTAVTPATLNTFLTEIRTLSLHRYLSEIISACFEGLCKLKTSGEIEAGIEIVSALHQRFGPDEFTQPLAWQLGKGVATPFPDAGVLLVATKVDSVDRTGEGDKVDLELAVVALELDGAGVPDALGVVVGTGSLTASTQ